MTSQVGASSQSFSLQRIKRAPKSSNESPKNESIRFQSSIFPLNLIDAKKRTQSVVCLCNAYVCSMYRSNAIHLHRRRNRSNGSSKVERSGSVEYYESQYRRRNETNYPSQIFHLCYPSLCITNSNDFVVFRLQVQQLLLLLLPYKQMISCLYVQYHGYNK